ncbi:MAG TPA: histidine phosphatase family protein [Anaerolineales bacterium]|nr:histidine phosphatase family protein [Anaerolineales bacterium]
MELYFIRHGQSQNNAHWGDPNYQESPDPALTEIGLEQARRLADYLEKTQPVADEKIWNIQNRRGFGLTHIYTSLMERAVQTAAPTARRLRLPFAAWIEIHESGGIYGRDRESKLVGLPGQSRSYFVANFPELALPESLDGQGWWNRPFETEEEAQERAARIWVEMLSRHADQEGRPEHRVALVSHGGFFVHLMCAILNMSWRQAAQGMKHWFVLNNCSISRLDVRGDDISIAYLNRTDHLPDHLITG